MTKSNSLFLLPLCSTLSVDPDPELLPRPFHVSATIFAPIYRSLYYTHTHNHTHTAALQRQICIKRGSGEGRRTSGLLILLTAVQRRGLVLLHWVIRLSLNRLLLRLCVCACARAAGRLIVWLPLWPLTPREQIYLLGKRVWGQCEELREQNCKTIGWKYRLIGQRKGWLCLY